MLPFTKHAHYRKETEHNRETKTDWISRTSNVAGKHWLPKCSGTVFGEHKYDISHIDSTELAGRTCEGSLATLDITLNKMSTI